MKSILACCVFWLIGGIALPAQIPAFPGAQGFGTQLTTGGRGGQVIYVSTLNCDGPGSLAEALSTPGPKYILFKVSGIIDCAAEIVWGDCYIAGQTSPGGVIVRGIIADDWYEPNNGAKNIIIRHLNSRPGSEQVRAGKGWIADDALRLDGATRVVIDHCSFANATDEAVQISRSNNLTIQFSQLAETIGDHYEFGGMLLNYSANGHRKDSISIHHNIWNRIGGRMPEMSCEQSGEAPNDMSCLQHPLHIELSNNLLWDQQIEMYYNSGFYTSNQEAPGMRLLPNFVNNLAVVRSNMCHGMFRDHMLSFSNNELFVSGNQLSRFPNYADYDLFYCCNDFCTAPNHPNRDLGKAIRRSARFPYPNITYTATKDLLANLRSNVGAFNPYSSKRRDQMNRRLMQPLLDNVIDTRPIDGRDYYQDAFKLDFSTPPAAPQDSDSDGMPDSWENTQGLNPNVRDHNGTQLSLKFTGIAGYTNLECYLNDLADRLVNGSPLTKVGDRGTEKRWGKINFDPSSRMLYVEIGATAPEGKEVSARVYNTYGATLAEANTQGQTLQVPLNHLPSGMHFVHIRKGMYAVTEKLFIP
ncbi:outer membrane adhesin-like protein [Haliscomenobacter hydrossis]|uniref:Outer membrane adhesin like protein n=1 Tax=Haliscomenobacter hydrossis (strain ATCC 27775 / DSM 1100 / LMG 10767 / O) TaxID=760192 RepID=F4L6M0_HALH1|nr:outer membrane adhesin-like protein [Haliscomenobacter hydrossis]AEE49863.1 putative outer membrane adhesin like protein [Haliscomenobacter hydrossis DSM 1100]